MSYAQIPIYHCKKLILFSLTISSVIYVYPSGHRKSNRTHILFFELELCNLKNLQTNHLSQMRYTRMVKTERAGLSA